MVMRRDVIVVGGGHNGLVAAAYLAKSGLSTLVCEQREVLGGAAVSEHPFGPDFTVTSLSYVVSLLPADLVADLNLACHGYHVFPQGPYFAPRASGGYLRLPYDRSDRHREISKFSVRDALAYEDYEAHLARLGAILGPLLDEIPPRLGSRRPPDLWRQGLLLRHLRKVDTRGAVDITRLLTGSIADLVERYFESDAMRGLLSVSGVIGTWAGPRSAGTAYVMLHHHIGDTGGQAGAWGFPRGGMGGVTAALAASARSFGAELRTAAPVARIRTSGGQVTGVTLASGEDMDAPVVITTAHPQISFLRLLDPADLPADFVADIKGWQTRSGTVKINLALGGLPVFASHPDFRAISRSSSLSRLTGPASISSGSARQYGSSRPSSAFWIRTPRKARSIRASSTAPVRTASVSGVPKASTVGSSTSMPARRAESAACAASPATACNDWRKRTAK